MGKISLAFLWHHHQPYYTDDVGGYTPLPWTRLHGIKDYAGMAIHLERHPGIRSTFNLVPSLVEQLEKAATGEVKDYFQVVSEKDADSLEAHEVEFMLRNFFSANQETMINPFERYSELLAKRGPNGREVTASEAGFTLEELRDLQVLFNLTWFHPLIAKDDDFLSGLAEKGRSFTEEEKHSLLEKQKTVLGEIIPRYKDLVERGQIEVTTSPYYHPIMPLLFEMQSAHQAMPGTTLPENRISLADDAAWQLEKGLELHEKVFGDRARGMWPPEGSVSPDVIKPLAERGIEWIATDEGILSASLGKPVTRDGARRPQDAAFLFRPYSLEKDGAKLSIVFRDAALSNAIGFEYQRRPHQDAVSDFIGYLEHVSRTVDNALVSVILDGENAWEYYPGGGVDFLEELYSRIEITEWIETVRLSEYLESHPPKEKIERLFSGSWINSNFYTWIGHSEDVSAWEVLFKARSVLAEAEKEGRVKDEKVEQARREIYIAEGSDWYWWFGDDHSSAHDDVFDELFRTHLMNVYRLIGDEPPPELARPIKNIEASTAFLQPRNSLNITVDGRVSNYFEWLGAGRYNNRKAQGSMERTSYLASDVFFGFDEEALHFRVDFENRASCDFDKSCVFRIRLIEPRNRTIEAAAEWNGDFRNFKVFKPDEEGPSAVIGSLKLDDVFELTCPLAELDMQRGEQVAFYIEIEKGGKTLERMPHGAPIYFTVPRDRLDEEIWL